MDAVIVAVLLAASVAALLLPLLRPPLVALRSAVGPASRLRNLEERKATLYGAIREVGFDLRTDKITQEDYEVEVARLKTEAVEVVREIETIKSEPPRADEDVERLIAAARSAVPTPTPPVAAEADGRFCTQCGRAAQADDRFCGGCGAEIEGASA